MDTAKMTTIDDVDGSQYLWANGLQFIVFVLINVGWFVSASRVGNPSRLDSIQSPWEMLEFLFRDCRRIIEWSKASSQRYRLSVLDTTVGDFDPFTLALQNFQGLVWGPPVHWSYEEVVLRSRWTLESPNMKKTLVDVRTIICSTFLRTFWVKRF